MQVNSPEKSVVSLDLYKSTLNLKNGLRREVTALRQAIEAALLRMDTPEGVEDAKLILAEIHLITTPTAIDTQEDCGCKDKHAH